MVELFRLVLSNALLLVSNIITINYWNVLLLIAVIVKILDLMANYPVLFVLSLIIANDFPSFFIDNVLDYVVHLVGVVAVLY